MIWTLEPTAPWRVTAAQALMSAEDGDAAFLPRFPVPDRPFVEAALLDALRLGESSCACQLRGHPHGLLKLTRLQTASGAPHAVLASWEPGPDGATAAAPASAANGTANGDARLVDDRTLRNFLGSISHDLRTPLNGVLGMSRLLLDSGLRADQIEHARAIDASAEQLLRAIEDLLEFATLDDDTPLHPVDVDPRMLVDEVLTSIAPRAAERELEVCALVSANVPEMVSVDPERVRQVLTYLVDEGIDRTVVGDVVIRVAPDTRGGVEPRLRFEIANDESAWPGAPRNGAAAGSLASLPSLPLQASSASFGSLGSLGSSGSGSVGTSGTMGTSGRLGPTGSLGASGSGSLSGLDAGGFGLAAAANGLGDESPGAAVCRHLVTLMGGALETSRSADGLTIRRFTVRALPRPALPFTAPRYVSLAGRRVLCVDDQAVSRRVLLEQLRGWQLSVEASDEAHGALTLMKVAASAGAPFEMVIIDLRLPGVDGLSLARLIRAEPALRAAKLVLLTAYPARGQAEVARQAGIDAYLEKPIREAPLRASLEALFSDEPADEHARAGEDRRPLRPRVLVADDHPLNQKVAVQLLQKLGCRVDVVSDGGDALDAVRRTPYHLVLLDSRLPSSSPDREGLRPGHSRRPPVIVLTGEDDETARNTAREAGASDVIAKPLRLNVLREKLAQWIVATPR
jgi:CheY-like chemotaxis protein